MNKIGLIAGAGELPVVFAKEVSQKKIPLEIFAFKKISDKKLKQYAPVKWFHFGEAQKLIDSMKKANVKDVVMLGKIEHYSLIFSFHKLDKKAKDFFSSLKDKRAKSILEAVIKELENEGFSFIDPSPYLSSLLVKEGLLNSIKPEKEFLKDAEFGLKIAKEIAQLDIGQTVVVKNGIVIAVEGIEGTDKCIIRGGKLGGKETVVCKVARKNQDMRYDVPVIGPKTLKSMKKAKAKVLAVEAGKTYLLEKEKFIKLADKYKISVIGFNLS
ncbi:MAG: LpxI family protein [Aquificae bacterium]|nr:LpxI family protein [Aquificota bacterium]